MAGSKSQWWEQTLLNFLLGRTVAFTPPTTVYLALSTAAYSDTATGSALNEVPTVYQSQATGYARVAVPNDATNWPPASSSQPTVKTNGQTLPFPTATAQWGASVVSFYLVDAPSGGNVLYGGDLTNSKVIQAGDTATFAQSAISIQEG